MKIGLIHYTGPPIVGGVESTIAFQARFLADQGHAVTILAGAGEVFDSRLTLQRIPAVHSRHPDVLTVKGELDRGTCGPAFRELRESLARDLEPALRPLDVVLAHNVLSLHKNLALTAALWDLATKPGPRWIAWHHDLAWDRPDYAAELHGGFPWDLLRTAMPRARHVAVSEAVQARVARVFDLPAHAVTVVPPGVDEPSFSRWTEHTLHLVNALDLGRADLLLLVPSRVTRRKNIGLAIRVLAELRRLEPTDARLLITGPPGPHNPANVAYLEELRGLVRELGLDGVVHFLYLLDPEDPRPLDDAALADLYRVCDAMLFPSLDEGFGIPVLEAGLARMPVFCSDIPPFRETGQEDVARFPLEAEPSSIAHLIQETLSADPAYRLRRRVRKGYSWTDLLTARLLPLLEGAGDA